MDPSLQSRSRTLPSVPKVLGCPYQDRSHSAVQLKFSVVIKTHCNLELLGSRLVSNSWPQVNLLPQTSKVLGPQLLKKSRPGSRRSCSDPKCSSALASEQWPTFLE
ncbi:uncharacterized protein LOC103793320 isoform X2 [Callithrix jacchus]